ncbi:MAG TPA: CCA tRNA nucleotidyltransferase [Candidatus Omnitrophica bacterium]|nr:CCA tRNA nucleotidyltransferase [Candidatus Omnitrophota bacterium]
MNLKILYGRLDTKIREILSQIFNVGNELGIKIYLVGGPVRDLLLNMEVVDVDLVVDKDLNAILENLKKKYQFKIECTRFLTAKIYLTGFTVDIAQARKEVYPRPGALPEVRNGSLKADAFRRDFTINALYLRIAEDEFSQLIDYVGGINDLSRKIIRVIKKESFWEDPTRIIRAIRYEQRFGFRMERKTLTLLKEAIKENVFSTVTGQRLGAEFIRTLKEKNPVNALIRMNQLCGFDFITSGVKFTSRKISLLTEWNFFPYKDKISSPEIIPLMILFSDLEPSKLNEASQKLELTRQQRKLISNYLSLDRKNIISAIDGNLSITRLYDKLKNFDFEIIACLYLEAEGKAKRNLKLFIDEILKLKLEIKGDDLKKLGVPSGPVIGKLLDKVRRAKLRGKLESKEDEIRYLKKLLKCG